MVNLCTAIPCEGAGVGGRGLRGEPKFASSARLHNTASPDFDEHSGQDSVSMSGPHTQGTALPKQDCSTWPRKQAQYGSHYCAKGVV